MMRKLVLIPLLAAVAACDTGGSTGPDAAVINVLVLDDRGVPVDRAEVNVTLPSATSVSALTRKDGTASVEVEDAGTYRVVVLPRAGYVGGSGSLARSVIIAPSTKATVEFTLYRSGLSEGPPLGP
ncbi:MAG TPA: hypothetical protein VF625_07825 [Longimicrobium sp.]|jgi:hypothetical protein